MSGGAASASNPATEFTGRTALVTGGSAGIGYRTCERLARAGMRVVLTARGQESGRAAAERIRAAGGDARFIPCDVSDADQVERLFTSVIREDGAIH